MVRKKNEKMKNICLVSITASHYRKLIYSLMDQKLNCDFVFGKDNTTVKRLNTSIFRHSFDIDNYYLADTNCYVQIKLTKLTDKYDVVINDLGIYCLSAWKILLLSRLKKQKVYNWDHGWYGREGFLKKWIKRAYFSLADGAFIYGNYARNLMIQNGFVAEKLHVIHNSLDYDKQLILRNEIVPSNVYKDYFDNNYPVICFIGRLTAVKKLDQILDALDILKKKGNFYNCVFIGDGSERISLEKKVVEYGLDKYVWFYGACYDEKTNAELIFNADLCVAPGNIGLTAIHAMMFGCPCISHSDFPWQMPEFEAIHENKTGSFFQKDNVKDLAECIFKWFAEKNNQREEVRKACFKEIDENWNPYKQLEIIRSVIYE